MTIHPKDREILALRLQKYYMSDDDIGKIFELVESLQPKAKTRQELSFSRLLFFALLILGALALTNYVPSLTNSYQEVRECRTL